MISNNLCNSCTNIGCEFQSGIVRTECVFYMPPNVEPDNCGNYVVMQPVKPQEPCGDAISRQAVLNALYALCDTGETLKENPWRDNPHIDAVIETIEELPPVTSQSKHEDIAKAFQLGISFGFIDGLANKTQESEDKE